MTQELRKLAEAANTTTEQRANMQTAQYHAAWAARDAFKNAATPAAILELLDRLEKAEKDAARYRWLREQIYVDEDKRLRITRTYLIADQEKTFQERLDDAIDSAMEASK